MERLLGENTGGTEGSMGEEEDGGGNGQAQVEGRDFEINNRYGIGSVGGGRGVMRGGRGWVKGSVGDGRVSWAWGGAGMGGGGRGVYLILDH